MRANASVVGTTVALLVAAWPLQAQADTDLRSWCQSTAKTFVESAYKEVRDKDGNVIDTHELNKEVLRQRLAERTVTGDTEITGQLLNRTLYLRTTTSLSDSEAKADVYGVCNSLTSRSGGRGSTVIYGIDPGQEAAQRKESAWQKYYRAGPACDNPVDWDATVECGNARIRAKTEFERKWARGDFAAQRETAPRAADATRAAIAE